MRANIIPSIKEKQPRGCPTHSKSGNYITLSYYAFFHTAIRFILHRSHVHQRIARRHWLFKSRHIANGRLRLRALFHCSCVDKLGVGFETTVSSGRLCYQKQLMWLCTYYKLVYLFVTSSQVPGPGYNKWNLWFTCDHNGKKMIRKSNTTIRALTTYDPTRYTTEGTTCQEWTIHHQSNQSSQPSLWRNEEIQVGASRNQPFASRRCCFVSSEGKPVLFTQKRCQNRVLQSWPDLNPSRGR